MRRKRLLWLLLALLLALPPLGGRAHADGGGSLSQSITSYTDYFLVDKKYQDQITKVNNVGNLTGRAFMNDGEWMEIHGWFEYRINVPSNGWYELILNYDSSISPDSGVENPWWPGYTENSLWKHDYVMDYGTANVKYLNPFPKAVDGGSGNDKYKKVGNVWLTQGSHTFRIQRWQWLGFHAIKGFEFKPVSNSELSRNIRVDMDIETPFGAHGGGHYLALDEGFHLNVYSAGAAAGTFTVEVLNKADDAIVNTYDVPIQPAASEQKHVVNIQAAQAGKYYLKYKANGQYIDPAEGLLDHEFVVIDDTPVSDPGDYNDVTKVQVGEEIDAATKAPDYSGGNNDSVFGGVTRVVNKSFGSYRETGNNGYMPNPDGSNYMAYILPEVQPNKHYMIEVDYPDDDERSFAVVLRQVEELYGNAGGIESGREYALSNGMKTFVFHFYPLVQHQPRIAFEPTQTHHRAAVSKIRLYEITDYSSLPVSPEGRDFGMFFEEPVNFAAMFGAPDHTPESYELAIENWAKRLKYLGGNVMIPTVAVYSHSLYPSRTIDKIHTSLHQPDYFKLMLLYANKYGLSVIGDFHRASNEMTVKYKYSPGQSQWANWAVDKNGNYQMHENDPTYATLNPIHPDNVEWLKSWVNEFANRYKDMDSFKGISIRTMGWQNPGLNNFVSLDFGYDDYTGQQFSQYLGIADPGSPQARYQTFTSAQYKEQWIDWRMEQINQIYSDLAQIATAAKPSLTLYSQVDENMVLYNKNALAEAGISDNSIDGFKWINGIYQYGRKSFTDDFAEQREIWDLDRQYLTDPDFLLALNGSRAYAPWAHYLEDAGQTLQPSQLGMGTGTFKWVSAHMAAAGRNYLEKYAYPLAMGDANLLINGGNEYFYDQPIVREFMAEYRKLPKDAFHTVNTTDDPIVIRDLNKNGTYTFYLVNKTNQPQSVELTFTGDTTLTRVTSGGQITTADNKTTIALDAFELQVFTTDGGVTLVGGTGGNAGSQVAYWAMDEGTGTTLTDSSGNNHNGTIFQGTWLQTGKKGKALSFNGVYGYDVGNDASQVSHISLPNSLGASDALTVAFWMKADELRNQMPMDKVPDNASGTGWGVKVRSDKSINIRIGSENNNADVGSANAYDVGVWTHVAFTFDNGTLNLYLNGSLVASQNGISQTPNVGSLPLTIGSNSEYWESYKGALDEIYLYDQALTDQQISDLYNS